MRVLMTAAECAPKLGGVERHVEALRRELAACGCDVTVLELGRGARSVRALPRLLRVLKTQQFETIHAHDFLPAIVTWIAMRVAGVRIRLHVTIHGYEGFPLKAHYVAGHRLAHRLAGKVIAVGSYIDSWYGTHSNLVVHGGVTPVRTSISAPHEPAASVVFVARLAADNNCIEVTQALIACSGMHGGVQCSVYGFGPLAERVQGMCAGTAVSFAGATVDAARTLSQASIVVANSYLTILEAFSLRKPVVAYCDNALKRDYLEELARASRALIVASTIADLEAAISRLLADRAEREYLASRAALYAERFSWSNVARDYLNLWETA